jgi:hypothetical protein
MTQVGLHKVRVVGRGELAKALWPFRVERLQMAGAVAFERPGDSVAHRPAVQGRHAPHPFACHVGVIVGLSPRVGAAGKDRVGDVLDTERLQVQVSHPANSARPASTRSCAAPRTAPSRPSPHRYQPLPLAGHIIVDYLTNRLVDTRLTCRRLAR